MGGAASRPYLRAVAALVVTAAIREVVRWLKSRGGKAQCIKDASIGTPQQNGKPAPSASSRMRQSAAEVIPPPPRRAPPKPSNSSAEVVPPAPRRAPPKPSTSAEAMPPRPVRAPPKPSDEAAPPRPTRAPPRPSEEVSKAAPPRPTRTPPKPSDEVDKAVPPRPTRAPPRPCGEVDKAVPQSPTRAPPRPSDEVPPSSNPSKHTLLKEAQLNKSQSQVLKGIELWICLDFEWTCDDGDDRKVRSDDVEIIEFSFAVYDARKGEMACEGQYYCKNERTPITDFCTELTGISDETLADAGSLADALKAFDKAMQAPELIDRPCCAMTHGCADLELVLPMHCKALGITVPTVLTRYVDLRLATQRYVHSTGTKGSRASTLKQICTALKLPMLGSEHCGLDDSWMVLLATQQLLLNGADLHIIDFVTERQAFLKDDFPFLSIEGRSFVGLCLDGLPFFAIEAEIERWLEHNIGPDYGACNFLVVLGMDDRPSGRAVVEFKSYEAAVKALEALEGGRILTCGDTPDTYSERLVLARPLRREERELEVRDGLSEEGSDSGPVLAPFPTDALSLRRSSPARGVCFRFQRNMCTRGDQCRYLHELLPEGDRRLRSQNTCFDFQKGLCRRGETCYYSHEIENNANTDRVA